MNRHHFLAALFGFTGIAKAREPFSDHLCLSPFPNGSRCPARNNECPVCGEMAEPFHPEPDMWCGDRVVMMLDGRNISGCDKELLPKSNLVRCKRCNAAFWQDAEDKA